MLTKDMKYAAQYDSPIGRLLLTADGEGLSGLWLYGSRYFSEDLARGCLEAETPVFEETRNWLDVYFSGREPSFTPALHLMGTPFQLEVWQALLKIPYGETASYGGIAKEIAKRRGLARMSAQAVGGAVGRNPIVIIVPCHRVIGADGSLTGFGGGLDIKAKLLGLEGII